MPTYEYICSDPDCAYEWEEIQSIKEEPLQICPLCEEETAKRQISRTSFVLVGGGWAKDSYGK